MTFVYVLDDVGVRHCDDVGVRHCEARRAVAILFKVIFNLWCQIKLVAEY